MRKVINLETGKLRCYEAPAAAAAPAIAGAAGASTATGAALMSSMAAPMTLGTATAGAASGISWGTAAMIGSTLLSGYSALQQGKASSAAMKAQADQAEAEARTQTIERKRRLIETLAQQNVGAAAQGRTISSIATLQQEDIRRAGYDDTLIKGGAAAQSSAAQSAASNALSSGYLSAGSSLLSGAYKYSTLGK